ncbi:MAG: phosphate ABC transporter permease PstA [Dehalococcoidia bacterium]|nr:phosphate ABC transporter permease PstA [Dehalococcoidia bacterium]
MGRRKMEEAIFKCLMVASVVIVVGVLLTMIVMVIWRGLPALDLSMITQTPKGGYYLGREGGILNAIVGSLYLAIGATVLAFVISLPVALFLQREYIGRARFAGLVRLCLDILWGIPSIVYGAFGFIIMLYLGMRASLLGGIVVLTLLEIPIMARAMDEVIRTVSADLKDASYALGATRSETAVKVVTRQVLPGILTAALLAFGRGIGDAASILFTAGYTDRIPTSLLDPVASLPLAIFFQLGTPFPEVRERAYASAVILLVIILLISIASRLLSRRLAKHVVK